MVKKATEMRSEVITKMRGGQGEVNLLHLFEKNEIKGKSRLVARITLNPGCSIGRHEHHDEEEIFYFIKGRGRVTEGDQVSEVGPGDAVLTGGGGNHAVENIGDSPLVFLAIILTY